ncbi:MAG: TetR/AcrR family transcriptional regulator [Sphingomonadaceae bacterium]|nr:TetR/AcrR family transcriptional regulator [Sphingomonadaceae bacterium]
MSRTPPVRKPKIVEQNRQNRRNLIVEKSSELFARYGYTATTTDMISEATGLNKGTIYYYYPSKADILYDICYPSASGAVDILEAARTDDPVENLETVVRGLMKWFQSRNEAINVHFHEEYILEQVLNPEQFENIRKIQRIFMKYFYHLISRGIAEGAFVQIDVSVTAKLIVGMIVGARRWRDIDREADRVGQAILELISHGMVSGERRSTRR